MHMLAAQFRAQWLGGSSRASMTTPESLSLIAMRNYGRFPGLSPKYPAPVLTQCGIQDPSSSIRAFASAPSPQQTSEKRLVKFPVERDGDLGNTQAWPQTHQVTLMRSPSSGLFSIVSEKGVVFPVCRQGTEHFLGCQTENPSLLLLTLTCR